MPTDSTDNPRPPDQRVPRQFTPRDIRLLERKQRRQIVMSIGLGVAVLSALVLVLYFTGIRPPEPVLSFQAAPDSVMIVNSSAESPTELAPGDSLEISQGTVQLDFDSGVRCIVIAPADLTATADNTIDIHEGTAWFQVPPDAAEFQVRTPGLVIIGGTEYGVISVPESTDEVHALKGPVDVRSQFGLKESRTLTPGMSARANILGELKAAPKLAAPFPTILPTQLHHLHFSFDGADPARASGNHPALAGFDSKLVQSNNRPVSERRVEGRFGQGISFDGKGDLIATNWPGLYGREPLTISFWVKIGDPSTSGAIIAWGSGKTETSDPNQWRIVLSEPRPAEEGPMVIRCSWGNNTTNYPDIPWIGNEWRHIAVVFNGTPDPDTGYELRLYLDGRQFAAQSQVLPRPPFRPSDLLLSPPLTLGTSLSDPDNGGRPFFHGALDEVHIIAGALTADQVLELYEKNTFTARLP